MKAMGTWSNDQGSDVAMMYQAPFRIPRREKNPYGKQVVYASLDSLVSDLAVRYSVTDALAVVERYGIRRILEAMDVLAEYWWYHNVYNSGGLLMKLLADGPPWRSNEQ